MPFSVRRIEVLRHNPHPVAARERNRRRERICNIDEKERLGGCGILQECMRRKGVAQLAHPRVGRALLSLVHLRIEARLDVGLVIDDEHRHPFQIKLAQQRGERVETVPLLRTVSKTVGFSSASRALSRQFAIARRMCCSYCTSCARAFFSMIQAGSPSPPSTSRSAASLS